MDFCRFYIADNLCSALFVPIYYVYLFEVPVMSKLRIVKIVIIRGVIHSIVWSYYSFEKSGTVDIFAFKVI